MSAQDQAYMSRFSTDYGAYNMFHLGTAAGTTTIASQPAFLSHIQVNSRAASGTIVIYDSAGTSASVVGSIVMGTQTNTDNPAPYTYKGATRVGLTVSYSAGLDLTVSALP